MSSSVGHQSPHLRTSCGRSFRRPEIWAQLKRFAPRQILVNGRAICKRDTIYPDFRTAIGTPHYSTYSKMWGRTRHYWLHVHQYENTSPFSTEQALHLIPPLESTIHILTMIFRNLGFRWAYIFIHLNMKTTSKLKITLSWKYSIRVGTKFFAFVFSQLSRNPFFVFAKSLWGKDETFVKVFAKAHEKFTCLIPPPPF
jgi:hypothetical protein